MVLGDVKFLIIKTHGSDKYDRYLVDVFYLKGGISEEAVMKKGIHAPRESTNVSFEAVGKQLRGMMKWLAK